MDIKQLTPRVYAALNHNSTPNAGIIVTDRGAIVVDTLGTPAAGSELSERAQALAGKPVTLVINTHYHFDHTFGNQSFSAPIAAHESLGGSLCEHVASELTPEEIAEHVAAHPEDAWLRDDFRLTPPQIGFIDRLTLQFGGPQVVVRHRGGHTACLSIVHVPEEGVVFASDLLFMGRTPFLRFADDIERWIKALRQIEAADAAIVVPGHGEPAATADVTRFRQYLGDLWGIVRRLAGQGKRKEEVLGADLPRWADDRPALQHANVAYLDDLVRG